jgi:hypothetical protein
MNAYLNQLLLLDNSKLDLTEGVIQDITHCTVALSVSGGGYSDLGEVALTPAEDFSLLEEGEVETYNLSYSYLVEAPIEVDDTLTFRLTPSDAGSVGADPFYSVEFTVRKALTGHPASVTSVACNLML